MNSLLPVMRWLAGKGIAPTMLLAVLSMIAGALLVTAVQLLAERGGKRKVVIIAGKQRKQAGKVSESTEQQCLFRWAAYNMGRWPELALLHHIPNGGSRTKAEAGKFKAEGVKAGVPDLCLPVPRGGAHGLYIEMKRQGGRVSPEQSKWLHDLNRQGYTAAVCYGWEAAASLIQNYLTEKMDQKGEKQQ